jgi:uncharacterized Fe-S cluster protein YjdI
LFFYKKYSLVKILLMKPFNQSYSNKEITVFFKPRLCIHAAVCIRELPKVFNLNRDPWVDVNGASTDEIIGCVERCPTGALYYERISEDKPSSSKVNETLVTLMKNGPLIIHNDCKFIDENGIIQIRKGKTAFCQCGLSSKKPFCDGSHIKLIK